MMMMMMIIILLIMIIIIIICNIDQNTSCHNTVLGSKLGGAGS